MSSAADIANEQDEGLKLLFQAGLELALQVQANAMAAEPAEQARLSLTFHRLSRGVRQTAALRMKLAREAERSGREVAADVIQLDQRRLDKRKAHVKAAVECLIWTEAESADAIDALKEDLSDLLDIETQDAPTFESEPLDAQIERLARVIGVPQSAHPREGGDPSGRSATQAPASPAQPLIRPASAGHLLPQGEKDEDEDDYWRSSA
jgi:hypothetical protein